MKTVNLELSKQLKEAGYPQEKTYFYYGYNPIDPNREMYLLPTLGLIPNALEWYSSPTADEILDQLPEVLFNGERIEITISHNLWQIRYIGGKELWIEGKSLADAAAKMWLYLNKEGLI